MATRVVNLCLCPRFCPLMERRDMPVMVHQLPSIHPGASNSGVELTFLKRNKKYINIHLSLQPTSSFIGISEYICVVQTILVWQYEPMLDLNLRVKHE